MKKCERCGKAATSHISSILNGKKEEYHFCNECFLKLTPLASPPKEAKILPIIEIIPIGNEEGQIDKNGLDENGIPIEYSSMEEENDCDCGVYGGESLSLSQLENLIFSMENVIEEVFPRAVKNTDFVSPARKDSQIQCSGCGISAQEIEKKQRAGCAKCYSAFGEVLLNRNKKLGDGKSYSGKDYRPKIICSDIDYLQNELNIAVKNQNFELAAKIRDNMKILSKRA